MRLTILNQFYVPDLSPTAHLAASLAEHRAAQGDTVTVVASRGGYVPASDDEKASRDDNPRIYRVWTPRLGKATVFKRCIDYGTFYLLALWRMIRVPRQDVIISLTTPPFIAWTALAHRLLHPRTRIVLWNMDCYPEIAERSDKIKADGIASRFMRWMNRRLFARVDHLVCLDTAMVELLMPQYAPKDRNLPVTVIPNWERASFFPVPTSQTAWSRAESLGLEGKFVVLYLGNMGYGHRFDTVMDAAEQLDSNVVFLFIGGGSRRAEIERLVSDRGLGNVILHDYVPKEETPTVMATADCALITLRDEALGVMSPSKLHSNLAMSLPIVYVGPAKSNVDDAIGDHHCGISLRHGDAMGLVRFIRGLQEDAEASGAMRRKARAAFDAAYCDTQTLPKFDAVLDSLGERTELA